MEVFRRWPRLVFHGHGPGLFQGEHALHILAVNRREDTLCELLELAHARLSRYQFVGLLRARASGLFFHGNPMAFYGSTLASFLASFGLQRAFYHLTQFDIMNEFANRLTDPEAACPVTGFLPLHAAVANGQLDMYDFLSGANDHLAPVPGELRLPSDRLAIVQQKTAHGLNEEWSELSPLQLAFKMGDKRMCRHILRKRLMLNWKWGPLNSFRMDLGEIDSAGEGGNDLLELVADFRAGHSTQSMLLDDFMQGFLFALVRQKWDQYTSYAFYGMRVVEAAYLTALIWLSMQLKQEPSTRWQGLAVFVLVVGLLLLSLEMVLMVLWWNNDVIHAFESFSGMRAKLHGLSLWARAFSWRAKLVGFASATAACVYYLWTAGDDDFTTVHDAPLYLLFGISSYVQGKTLFAAICVSPQLPKMGVQIIIIDKMFHNDVTTYLTFLVAFTVNYFFAMYISLPANASEESVVGHNLLNGRYVQFDMTHPLTGLNAMFEQAVIGIRFTPNFAADAVKDFSNGEWMSFIFFYAIHLTFCVVCIILLVRLLMAMMTNTFRVVQEQAQLEWRLLLTRHVLRLEVLGDLLFNAIGSERLSRKLLAGTHSPIDGKYYFHFLDVPTVAGEPKTVPMQLAQPGEHDPLFDVNDQGGAAFTRAGGEEMQRRSEPPAAAAAAEADSERPNPRRSIIGAGSAEGERCVGPSGRDRTGRDTDGQPSTVVEWSSGARPAACSGARVGGTGGGTGVGRDLPRPAEVRELRYEMQQMRKEMLRRDEEHRARSEAQDKLLKQMHALLEQNVFTGPEIGKLRA